MSTRRRKSLPINIIYIALGVVSVLLLLAGINNLESIWGPSLLAAGIISLVVTVALAPVAISLKRLIANEDRRSRNGNGAGASSSADFDHMIQQLLEISNNSVLTDEAKRLLFADREREVIRKMIESYIAVGDYETAKQFCKAIEEVLGYGEDAQACRQLIDQASNAVAYDQISGALAQFEAALAQRNWSEAFRQAAHIRQICNDPNIINQLDQRVTQSRNEHKRNLENQFLNASNSGEIEIAMTTLKELDKYLTPEEAARLTGNAQETIAKHRDQLGETFRKAVQEKRWADAARAGNSIVAEYPNTKMADEVRSMIDMIRTRATQEALTAGVSK